MDQASKECKLDQDRIGSSAAHVIRETFTYTNIELEKIIFFGSRARGDYNDDSDWDFLVVSRSELPINVKHKLIIRIKRQLAKLRIPNDIIIQSLSNFEFQKNFPGNIAYAANLEGIVT